MLRLNPIVFCVLLSGLIPFCHAQRSSDRLLAPQEEQAELVQELVAAIRAEDLGGVNACIEAGVDVCRLVRDDKYKILGVITDGWSTPMHIAAGVGNVSIMEALYKAGADIRKGFYRYFPHRNYPRFFTALYGLAASTCDYLREGLKRRAPKPKMLGAPIHRAAGNGHLKGVQFLLARGESIDRLSLFGITPLLLAGTNGHGELVKYLCKEGADRSLPDPISLLPLQEYVALCAGNEVAQCLDPEVFNVVDVATG